MKGHLNPGTSDKPTPTGSTPNYSLFTVTIDASTRDVASEFKQQNKL